MLLIDVLLLVLMNEWLLVKCRLLHILLTMTVLLTHRRTVLLLLVEIFHAVALAACQALLCARTQHQGVDVAVNVLKGESKS